ncbi:class I SAM-dependent methyltransferase [Desulfitobacterium metallireducens]|uniref:SAM-dependent methyltransferase n=1 Tax=Desulfitobacterium metallireducens DSM 15288 TaxID=871968 RepID=W0EE92_9FIRM|nr:class I SAM-dependent methyltransferase [Desulfitobacterium metallireducens]AHF07391.1 SAM-dependent methyltransferase [Desulfitobacterium metallireducens DSM 15288]
MLNSKGFDNWAGEYDESISKLSEGYPFEGYYEVLSFVSRCVDLSKGTRILDIGVGTGLLTKELYNKGVGVYGIDFSPKMLELARRNMPNGQFLCHDFTNGLPIELKKMKFNYIISSYAIHHLDDNKKIDFIAQLKDSLEENGNIIIADIAFQTKDDMKQCKDNTKGWDEDEIYIVADEIMEKMRKKMLNATYTQISSCAGVLEIV